MKEKLSKFKNALREVLANDRHADGMRAYKNLGIGMVLIAADFIPVVGEVDNVAKVIRTLGKRGITLGRVTEAAIFLDSSPNFEVKGCLGVATGALAWVLPLEIIDFAGETFVDARNGRYKDGWDAFKKIWVLSREGFAEQSIGTAGNMVMENSLAMGY